MGESIFSFHKNVKECAEAAEAYLAVPLSCPETLSSLSSRLETGRWEAAEADDPFCLGRSLTGTRGVGNQRGLGAPCVPGAASFFISFDLHSSSGNDGFSSPQFHRWGH